MPIERQSINWDDSLKEVLLKMSEQNAGALRIMIRIMNQYGRAGLSHILLLDDMNIRGTQIFVGYKYHCKGNLQTFVKCIKNRDPEMVETINGKASEGMYPHKALAGGVENGRREFIHPS